MPKKRQPREIWNHTREIVFERDEGVCVRCKTSLTLKTAHIDHIVSGKCGSNHVSNLRTLCRRCHVLRADLRHRGMIGQALKKNIIPVNWRDHIWE